MRTFSGEERVVVGLLDDDALDGEPAVVAADAMRSTPTTIRPHLTLEEALDALKERDHVLVTTSDGRLLGLLWRLDAERRLAESGKDVPRSR